MRLALPGRANLYVEDLNTMGIYLGRFSACSGSIKGPARGLREERNEFSENKGTTYPG
ncbi:hypothetical protein [Oceanispirochaeta crateris]|uniref:hypothetical protein n=1 Tax=Oceanispirochaeta crateris TaxID=2518645 RepID=UPI00143DA2A9|nr:hypothetical protein [Oceanispirochaeta crateris]